MSGQDKKTARGLSKMIVCAVVQQYRIRQAINELEINPEVDAWANRLEQLEKADYNAGEEIERMVIALCAIEKPVEFCSAKVLG